MTYDQYLAGCEEASSEGSGEEGEVMSQQEFYAAQDDAKADAYRESRDER